MKKICKLTALLLVLAMSLAACGGSGGSSGDSPAGNGSTAGGASSTAGASDNSGGGATGGDLTVVISGDPGTLDPHDNVNFNHHQVTRQIFETLLVRDEAGELQPWLAESWEYQDDVTILFKIRQGVKFHNGDELKASDVLFSLKRAREDNTTGAIQVGRIDFDKSEVVDDYTVKVVTDAPYAMQLPMLENPLSAVISEKVYTESGGDFFKGCIGTGPFKYVSYNSGDSVKLEKNADYWREGEPKVDSIQFRIITDASSRAIEAESGGSNIVYDISANDVERVGSASNVNLVSGMGANTSYILFNTEKKPLDDIRVREAIWLGVDVPSAIKIAYGNYGAVADGYVSPGIEGRHPDLTPYFPTRNVEAAKALLAEAGQENLTLSIICENSNQQRMDFCEAVQSQLAEIGITLELNFMEVNAWATAVIQGDMELAIYGLTASSGEAGRILMRWLPENAEYNACNWYNEPYIENTRNALATIDADTRNKMYADSQVMLMEAKIALPIWHKEINAALSPQVQGFYLMPSYEQHYLQYVSLAG